VLKEKETVEVNMPIEFHCYLRNSVGSRWRRNNHHEIAYAPKHAIPIMMIDDASLPPSLATSVFLFILSSAVKQGSPILDYSISPQ